MSTITDLERKLRPRQIRFARLVASGVIPAKAYPQAGYLSGSPKATGAHASRLVACGRIRQAIRAYQDAELEAASLSVAARKRKLSELAVEDIRNERQVPIREPNISAIRELNRMERIGADPIIPSRIELLVVHDSSARLREVQAIDGDFVDTSAVQPLIPPSLP